MQNYYHLSNLDDRLGPLATHGCSEAAVQLHHDQLLEKRLDVALIWQREVIIVGGLKLQNKDHF